MTLTVVDPLDLAAWQEANAQVQLAAACLATLNKLFLRRYGFVDGDTFDTTTGTITRAASKLPPPITAPPVPTDPAQELLPANA